MYYFLSYTSSDQKEASALANGLLGAGLQLWTDLHDIQLGKPFPPQLEEALHAAGGVLGLVGEHATGPWAGLEMDLALQEQAERKELRIIPVLLPGVKREQVPRRLRLYPLLFLEKRPSQCTAEDFAQLKDRILNKSGASSRSKPQLRLGWRAVTATGLSLVAVAAGAGLLRFWSAPVDFKNVTCHFDGTARAVHVVGRGLASVSLAQAFSTPAARRVEIAGARLVHDVGEVLDAEEHAQAIRVEAPAQLTPANPDTVDYAARYNLEERHLTFVLERAESSGGRGWLRGGQVTLDGRPLAAESEEKLSIQWIGKGPLVVKAELAGDWKEPLPMAGPFDEVSLLELDSATGTLDCGQEGKQEARGKLLYSGEVPCDTSEGRQAMRKLEQLELRRDGFHLAVDGCVRLLP